MKNLRTTTLLIVAILFSVVTYGQVNLKINKPIAEKDKAEIQTILKSFDSNSYNIDVKTEKGTLRSGKAVGLADVKQGKTVRPESVGTKAATNTNINIFKSAAAATNTNINIFKSNAAATNTNINIFKTGKFNNEQLSQLDKLYHILNKYQ
ncbi:hypothetical protein [Flavobacterium sp. N502540]|uniref:hypothetical protein n=1 Tax=Flavobacterium sp. N502540 TaxID=2986838 RepID=UPI0022246755|nr:hypothetical protein [Flavobacterium sp. N502540]